MLDLIDFQKRYYYFALSEYYPAGGLSDVVATFDNLNDALNYYSDIGDYFCIWDRIEAKIIKEW